MNKTLNSILIYFRQRPSHGKRAFLAVVFFLIALAFGYWALFLPGRNFPVGTSIAIERGETISTAATKLYENNAISSPLLYTLLARIASPRYGVIAGDYVFDRPLTLFEVVAQTTNFSIGQRSVRITVIEGLNNRQIAELFAKRFETFNKEEFLKHAEGLEGYLFPDTYIFSKGIPEAEIVKAMHDNFLKKTADLEDEILASGRTREDVVTMASILEREARTKETRQMIAGILWKRLDKNIPLQVDASFYYLLGKDTPEITKTDLASDSPYNTYKHKGLPPGPIANPGYYAIRDAVMPKENSYLFYLSDKDGEMHYAKTYEGHLANKRKYLD